MCYICISNIVLLRKVQAMIMEDELRKKEEKLANTVFEWAMAKGFASDLGQIKVTIRINQSAFTISLADEDWRIIFDDALEWTVEEKAFLLEIKAGGNHPCRRPDNEDYRFAQRIRSNLGRTKNYFLSDSQKGFCVKRRIISPRKNRRLPSS